MSSIRFLSLAVGDIATTKATTGRIAKKYRDVNIMFAQANTKGVIYDSYAAE